jgi:hypothetical protein
MKTMPAEGVNAHLVFFTPAADVVLLSLKSNFSLLFTRSSILLEGSRASPENGIYRSCDVVLECFINDILWLLVTVTAAEVHSFENSKCQGKAQKDNRTE